MTRPKPAPKAQTPPKTPKAAKFNKDGSISLDLGAGGQVTLTQPTIGQLTEIMEIEEALNSGEPDMRNDWKLLPQWYADVLGKVYGIEVDTATLPGWTANPSVKRAIVTHFFNVPFDLPAFDLPAQRVMASQMEPEMEPNEIEMD